MVYLKSFELVSENMENNIVCYQERRNIFNNYYPLGIFPLKDFYNIKFDNITIFYGGNGSGKTTLLNILSEKIRADRKSKIDKGSFFHKYVDCCNFLLSHETPLEIKLITSDDVFDYLLDIRSINTGVNRKKEYLSNEYLSAKYDNSSTPFKNYDKLRQSYDAKRQSMSKYIRERLINNNIIEKSNGESSLMFFEQEIKENSLYILDEPENSLSALNQLKLKQYIEDSARFYNCQFIISTHSPFLLDLLEAKIYDLDETPVCEKKWCELSTIKFYYDFFKEREDRFKNE